MTLNMEERSILLSSHITSDLEKIADYIAFMHNGNVILYEIKDDLIYNFGVVKCNEQQFDADDNMLSADAFDDVISKIRFYCSK